MSDATVMCDVCGQPAVVLHASYDYERQLYGDATGRIVHKLIAAHYEIECPTCGRRKMTVRHADPT